MSSDPSPSPTMRRSTLLKGVSTFEMVREIIDRCFQDSACFAGVSKRQIGVLARILIEELMKRTPQ